MWFPGYWLVFYAMLCMDWIPVFNVYLSAKPPRCSLAVGLNNYLFTWLWCYRWMPLEQNETSKIDHAVLSAWNLKIDHAIIIVHVEMDAVRSSIPLLVITKTGKFTNEKLLLEEAKVNATRQQCAPCTTIRLQLIIFSKHIGQLYTSPKKTTTSKERKLYEELLSPIISPVASKQLLRVRELRRKNKQFCLASSHSIPLRYKHVQKLLPTPMTTSRMCPRSRKLALRCRHL